MPEQNEKFKRKYKPLEVWETNLNPIAEELLNSNESSNRKFDHEK